MSIRPRSVFGFAVEAAIPLRFLRLGAGRDTLRVDAAPGNELAYHGSALFEWKFKDPAGDVSGRLHNADGIYHFWTADAGWFRIDPVARAITISNEADETRRELRLWGVPTTLCSIERGDVSLHAAAVEINGGAVLLAAPGQHGKTTLALAFHARRYRVLSEDVSCCVPGATPMLFPGPASLRVRPDMYGGSPPRGTEVVSIQPDRVFLRFDEDGAATADPLPLRAVVFLRQCDDQIRLEEINPVRSLPDLLALTFRVPGVGPTAEAFRRVSELVRATTVWNLYRPLRMDNLETVVATIATELGSESRLGVPTRSPDSES